MKQRQKIAEIEFHRRGALTAGELAASLAVSQPTVARLLAGFERQRLLRLGQARATRYALTREISGLGSSWPLYEIDTAGRPSLVGRLHALEARQWCLQQDEPWETLRGREFPEGLYPDFPWFLDDLRPQGFLGRAFARAYAPSLGLSPDPRAWRADDVVMALLRHGHDLQGGYVLGEAMLAWVQNRRLSGLDLLPASSCSAFYPARAEAMLAGEWPGSSAAGEQPKFTTCVQDDDATIRHVIVKFSGLIDRPEARRWADLLVAEHLAASILLENGLAAVHTRVMVSGGRCFLESTRFDRVGEHGRRGLVSLAALDAAFFGQLHTPWTAAAERLHDGGWLSAEDADTLSVLWWFGNLIGNTDMHYGNVSFFLDRCRPFRLSPAYDMLPMLYRPDTEGGLSERPFTPTPPPPEAIQPWSRAVGLAKMFWERVAGADEVSPGFRTLAEKNALVVDRYRTLYDQFRMTVTA